MIFFKFFNKHTILKRYFCNNIKNLELFKYNKENESNLFSNIIPDNFEKSKIIKLIYSYFENEDLDNLNIHRSKINDIFNEIDEIEIKIKLLKLFCNKSSIGLINDEYYLFFLKLFSENIQLDKTNIKIDVIAKLWIILLDSSKNIELFLINKNIIELKDKIDKFFIIYFKHHNIENYSQNKKKDFCFQFSKVLFFMTKLNFKEITINDGINNLLLLNIERFEINQLITWLYLVIKSNNINLNYNLKEKYLKLINKKNINDKFTVIFTIQEVIWNKIKQNINIDNIDFHYLYYLISINNNFMNIDLIKVVEFKIADKINNYDIKKLVIFTYSNYISLNKKEINKKFLNNIYKNILNLKNDLKSLDSNEMYLLIFSLRLFSKEILNYKNNNEMVYDDSIAQNSFILFKNTINIYSKIFRKYNIISNIRCIYEISNKFKYLTYSEFISYGFSEYLLNLNSLKLEKLSLFDVITYMFIIKRFLNFNESYYQKYLFFEAYLKNYKKKLNNIEHSRINMIIDNSSVFLKNKKSSIKYDLYNKFNIILENLNNIINK